MSSINFQATKTLVNMIKNKRGFVEDISSTVERNRGSISGVTLVEISISLS